MTLLDLVIIVVAVLATARGYEIGLFRQGLSLVGFFVGLFLGSLAAPWVGSYGSDLTARTFLILITTLGSAAVGSALGEAVGLHLRALAERFKLESIDAFLGAVLEVIGVLVTAWLVAAAVSGLPVYGVGRAVKRSKIISALDAVLPPAPGVIARLEHYIDPNGFPKAFIGQEPNAGPAAPPPPADVAAAAAADRASVDKIEGVGCGGVVEGSGFVAAPGLVATNAHVVAGVRQPVVHDAAGTHPATPVYFDPNLDFAVLRVNGLAGAPLNISGRDVGPGTNGAVLGYPGGGPYTAVGAVVLAETNALGRNIYDEGVTRRSIYELQAGIEPGNSGGPLVTSDGTVIGVVFARSVSNDSQGYALTSTEIMAGLRQAQSAGPVGTGPCAAG